MIKLATSQYIRDNVCKEILLYGEFKEAWGQGFIKIERRHCRHYVNGKLESVVNEPDTLIYGYYVDECYEKKIRHIGFKSLKTTLKHAKVYTRMMISGSTVTLCVTVKIKKTKVFVLLK